MTHAEMKQFCERVGGGRQDATDDQLTELVVHFETCEHYDCHTRREYEQSNERALEKLLRELWGDPPYGFKKQWLAQVVINHIKRQ